MSAPRQQLSPERQERLSELRTREARRAFDALDYWAPAHPAIGAAQAAGRTLLAEVERLRAHLAAEHLATEAAETENDQLRARLDEIGETREMGETIATAIESLPEPEPDANYAVPAWYAGYEQAMEGAARIARGEVDQVPDA